MTCRKSARQCSYEWLLRYDVNIQKQIGMGYGRVKVVYLNKDLVMTRYLYESEGLAK